MVMVVSAHNEHASGRLGAALPSTHTAPTHLVWSRLTSWAPGAGGAAARWCHSVNYTHTPQSTRAAHTGRLSLIHAAARSRVLRGAPSLCHRVDRQHGGRGTSYAAAANAAVHLACGPWIRARLCDGCAIEPSAGQPRQRLPAATRGYTHVACSGTMCSYDHRPLLDAVRRQEGAFKGLLEGGSWTSVRSRVYHW